MNPFEIPVENPPYLSEGQKEAIARMKNVIERNGLCVLSGDIGSGKSMLLRMLTASLPETKYQVVYICRAGLIPKELYSSILRNLGEEPAYLLGRQKQQWQAMLENRISDNGRRLVILIDEAHELPSNTLLELRFLMNHRMDLEPPFTLILAGQGRLRTDLRLKAFEAISQRVRMQYHMIGMSQDEVKLYIESRMLLAKMDRPLFADSAIELVYGSSQGIPRLINQICGQAIFAAENAGDAVIEEKHLITVLADMDKQRGIKP